MAVSRSRHIVTACLLAD